MDVGVSLPTMAVGYGPTTTVDWARGIDAGPFSSVSAGERITFSNPELVASLAAAAAVTDRVRVFANVVIAPAHPAAVIAKQMATLDLLSDGRLDVGVGVGGRGHDYRAAEASRDRRHARLDESVAELRRLWAGEPPFPGADPVGPACVQAGGPPLLAAAVGPLTMARAAQWADGVTGFSVTGSAGEIAEGNQRALDAWASADRPERPRLVTGAFVVAGVDDGPEVLRAFTRRYLGIFGEAVAGPMSSATWISSSDDVARFLDQAQAAGTDEAVLVPGTVDLACLDALAEVVAAR